MDPIEVVEYKGYKIKLFQDEDPVNPRENDNLGLMLCKHRRYNLGDVDSSKEMTPEEIKEYVMRKDVIALPLFLLDHSGLWMRTGRFECDSQGWDTSMVGYITVTYEKALEEFSRKKMSRALRKKVLSILDGEVQTYSDYLEGNVVGYVIESPDGKEKDSCWGYYPEHSILRGREEYDHLFEECRETIDGFVKEEEKVQNVKENVTSA